MNDTKAWYNQPASHFEAPKQIDRSEVSRALAKAIAYKNCGKDLEAEQWARELVRLLHCSEILK